MCHIHYFQNCLILTKTFSNCQVISILLDSDRRYDYSQANVLWVWALVTLFCFCRSFIVKHIHIWKGLCRCCRVDVCLFTTNFLRHLTYLKHFCLLCIMWLYKFQTFCTVRVTYTRGSPNIRQFLYNIVFTSAVDFGLHAQRNKVITMF